MSIGIVSDYNGRICICAVLRDGFAFVPCFATSIEPRIAKNRKIRQEANKLLAGQGILCRVAPNGAAT